MNFSLSPNQKKNLRKNECFRVVSDKIHQLNPIFPSADISLQHDIAPSKLAAMCLAAVRFKRDVETVWPIRLIKLTHYTWESIEPYFAKLFDIKLIPRNQLEAELEENIHLESTQIEFE